jgi:dihydropteroate synthase
MKGLSGNPQIMGILNVTPDSFSDGGKYADVQDAIQRVREMVAEGASIIDVGGESSRPGSLPVSASEQLDRVMPIIKALQDHPELHSQCLISIDTSHSLVADAALAAGAGIVNDITAGLGDSEMLGVVASRNAQIVLMHMQGTPETMQVNPIYKDVVDEVLRFLESRAVAAMQSGIPTDRILIDPGIGFGKTTRDNLLLLAALDRFRELGFRVLLGTSRKRFMGSICKPCAPADLAGATVATTVFGVLKGVSVFRVHDVRANRQALDVALAIQNAGDI